MPLNHKKSGFLTGSEGDLRENLQNLDKCDDFQLKPRLKQEASLRI